MFDLETSQIKVTESSPPNASSTRHLQRLERENEQLRPGNKISADPSYLFVIIGVAITPESGECGKQ